MPLLGVDNVHEFRTDGVAVGALQSINDIPQRRITGPVIQIAHLKHGIGICSTELMEPEFQVRNRLPDMNSQGIEIGPLVAPLAISGDQLHHPDLLTLIFGGL